MSMFDKPEFFGALGMTGKKDKDEPEKRSAGERESSEGSRPLSEIMPALERGDAEGIEAVKKYGHLLQYLPEHLRADRSIVLMAVKSHGLALEFASKELRNDREVVMEAIKETGNALSAASKELQDDPLIVHAAVERNPWALDFASDRLRNDPEICLQALKGNHNVIERIPKKLLKDQDFISKVLAVAPESARWLEVTGYIDSHVQPSNF